MEWIFLISVWALFGLWTKSIAEKKGYDGTTAFFLGFLGGLFAVIIYAFLNPKKK